MRHVCDRCKANFESGCEMAGLVLCERCRKAFAEFMAAGSLGTDDGPERLRVADWASRYGTTKDRILRWLRREGVAPVPGARAKYMDARGVLMSAKVYELTALQRKDLEAHLERLKSMPNHVGRKRRAAE